MLRLAVTQPKNAQLLSVIAIVFAGGAIAAALVGMVSLRSLQRTIGAIARDPQASLARPVLARRAHLAQSSGRATQARAPLPEEPAEPGEEPPAALREHALEKAVEDPELGKLARDPDPRVRGALLDFFREDVPAPR